MSQVSPHLRYFYLERKSNTVATKKRTKRLPTKNPTVKKSVRTGSPAKNKAPARSRLWTASELKKRAMGQGALLEPMNATNQPDPFLGNARSVVIVCHCAQTSPANLPRTLAQLGVNGIPFQKCVLTGVNQAGYSIDIDDIPNASSNTLLDVVTVIQNAPRKV